MHRFDKLGPKRSMNKIKYGDEAGNGVLSLVLSLELVDYATEICPNGKGNHIEVKISTGLHEFHPSYKKNIYRFISFHVIIVKLSTLSL